MENSSSSCRVSSWRNIDEFKRTYHQIFDAESTLEDKRNAFQTLQIWKLRRSQETLTGVICTLTLLDIHIKDATGAVMDRPTLCTLYSSTLTKFINFATSFKVGETSMYRSANKLGIESFLIDLRHICSHGKQLPSLEVFRRSNKTCLDWIKQFFWDQELKNISDATSKEIRFDVELSEKLKEIFPFYDVLAELLHKNVVRFQDLTGNDITKQRWPTIEKFMQQNKLKNFSRAFKFVTTQLAKIIELRAMNHNPCTFFHEMLEHCEFFMQTIKVEESNLLETSLEYDGDDDHISSDIDESPVKRKKVETSSVINLYQPLMWQIAKHGHMKLFIDMLYQISLNESETERRRMSARFWIVIVLRSFEYYQRYCKFSKNNTILETKISQEVRNVYSYQLDADLKKVFIFVGTQLLPSSLKYSRDFFNQVLNNVDENSVEIALNLLPFVNPPLTSQQLDEINGLISIRTNSSRQSQMPVDDDKVYKVEDLAPSLKLSMKTENENVIWKKSLDNIDWSLQPIGTEFSI